MPWFCLFFFQRYQIIPSFHHDTNTLRLLLIIIGSAFLCYHSPQKIRWFRIKQQIVCDAKPVHYSKSPLIIASRFSVVRQQPLEIINKQLRSYRLIVSKERELCFLESAMIDWQYNYDVAKFQSLLQAFCQFDVWSNRIERQCSK